jgi:hypothetical protein
VLDKSNNLVFECVSDDIYENVHYNDTWWELRHLISHFIDEEFTINTVEFTTTELNQWLLQKAKDNVNKLQSEGYIVHGGPNND